MSETGLANTKKTRNFLTSPDDAPEFRTKNFRKNYTFPDAALTFSRFVIYHSGCLSLLLFVRLGHLANWLLICKPLNPALKHISVKKMENDESQNQTLSAQHMHISLRFTVLARHQQ